MELVPSKKATEPAGVPAAGEVGVTVAEKCTAAPRAAGLRSLLSAVVVSPWLTVKDPWPLLAAKLPLAAWLAAIVWGPTDSPPVVNSAMPTLGPPARNGKIGRASWRE